MEKIKLVKFSPLTLRKSGDEFKGAGLTWSIRKGFPRITVYTGGNILDKDKKLDYSKIIIAPFDYTTMIMFLDYFKNVIESKEEIKYKVNCYNNKFVDNKRTDDIIIQASVIIGKDLEGIVYISVVEENKKSIKFELIPEGKWHKFFNGNNEEIVDKKDLSLRYSRTYYDLLKSILLKEFFIDATEELTLDSTKEISIDNISEEDKLLK